MGPEQDLSVLANQTDGIRWGETEVGYGVRGSYREDLAVRFGVVYCPTIPEWR